MDNGIRTLKDSFESIPIDENFKLIAGPGAGKTTFLVNHIRNVVKNSDKLKNSRKILCITYTNVAVDTIKERLGNYANEVEISTIHHFLYKHILKPYIWILKDEIPSNLLDLNEVRISFPSFSVLPQPRTKQLLTWNHYTVNEIIYEIGKVYWTLDENDNIKPKYKGEMPFGIGYMLEYKRKLWDNQKITPEDILKFSYEILVKEPIIIDILRIKFPYVFVDEFQDVCNVQSKIIELLCEKKVNVGVIGDPAQSIYSFRGADYGNLEKINLDMKLYEIKNNSRSTDKIVNVLNNLRNDALTQLSTRNGNAPPKILIGNELKAYNYAKNILDSDLTVLSYKHEELNDLNFKIESEDYSLNREWLEKFWKTDDHPRDTIVEYTIKTIESFHEGDIKKAIRHMIFASHYFESDENKIIKKLFQLSINYDNFKDKTLKEFYLENIYIKNVKNLRNFRSGKANDIYESLHYRDLVRDIKNRQDNNFRTIHSCKGAEFENVLILTKNHPATFLFNFNITTDTHRLYYVAMSRARENLFISIPELENSKYSELEEKGFEIIDLNHLEI